MAVQAKHWPVRLQRGGLLFHSEGGPPEANEGNEGKEGKEGNDGGREGNEGGNCEQVVSEASRLPVDAVCNAVFPLQAGEMPAPERPPRPRTSLFVCRLWPVGCR